MHGRIAEGYFTRLLYAKDQNTFNRLLEEFRPLHPEAIRYIEDIPHDRWATYAFPLP